MQDLIITLDNNALKTSINKVVKSISDDLIDLRNKTPKVVAKKILTLSQALVPVYTGTLKQSGHIETKLGMGGGTSIIYDATKGEQVEAQRQKFGKVYFPLYGDDPNESYADDVDANTEFFTAAVELYAHGTPPTVILKESGKTIYLDMDLELPKKGYLLKQDIVTATRRTKAKYKIASYIEKTKKEGYGELTSEEKAYIKRKKKKYKQRFGVDYKE